ncbi:arylsulfatase [Xylariaceae sp. FL1651]|nr:arylsulfatase [Xylariaceae sp. FL1651]
MSFLALVAASQCLAATTPNVVFIFTDDQDLRHDSLHYMPILQKELVAKGTSFTNHFATLAQCCPSRSSLFRGQAGHNTNITNVQAPGGNYDKWVASGQDKNYLPHWLVDAGYNAECMSFSLLRYIGKFLNGYNIANYATKPKGWTHVDATTDPYTYSYNNVVMSADGETPVAYHGYHQTDVLRAKALDRIKYLHGESKPFYLTIAPVTPHLPAVPLERHSQLFLDKKAPRPANFNPADEIQRNTVSWVADVPLMTESQINATDELFRKRIQGLQGVDEIIEDVVALLGDLGILDNTFIVYSSDNGYHLGNHRLPHGKTLPFVEDTNLPFIVRGPGVPANKTSELPSAHLDLAPTFLEIAGVAKKNWPTFFDGRSLLTNWKNPNAAQPAQCGATANVDTPEILNVEFWGDSGSEAPVQDPRNTYKSLRIVSAIGSDGATVSSYLYSRWCTNETELYDTVADPYEIHNLSLNPDAATTRLLSRLNALLLATKSCAEVTCRNPWRLLQPEPEKRAIVANGTLTISCLGDALKPQYDDFFASIPNVAFQECKEVQLIANERPYWPADLGGGLGLEYRDSPDTFVTHKPNPKKKVEGNAVNQGTQAQRNVTLSEIEEKAKVLTADQLG